MSDAKFAEVGAALDRVALRSAAEAYLDRATDWPLRDADDLARSLAELPHISRWAARVATADYTGDFSVYPYDDLTVRTLAHKIAPALHLPSSDHEFVRMWRRWASDRTTLHSLTLFTLTWGAHARTHA
ncbi:hypothetical protein ACFYVL_27910 [Streptomyces sp. NPDC004111]|uniref:hypothetical protein n=1 Tax=Streptomyces sp. NPDC004111 TaxID=3364690 RepID=UPI0036B2FAB5